VKHHAKQPVKKAAKRLAKSRANTLANPHANFPVWWLAKSIVWIPAKLAVKFVKHFAS
jgi:hypothetical protein